MPDEGIIFGAKGPITVTTDLVVDKFVDPQEGASKDLAVDRIGCCDVQLDGRVRNTKFEYLGCCKRGVRTWRPLSRKVVGQGRHLGDSVGRSGKQIHGHDGGKNGSS